MSTDDPSLLRRAASSLLANAPIDVVRTVLGLLVSGQEPPAALPPIVRPRGRPGRLTGAKAAASSTSWLALRARVRKAMAEHGLDAAGLAHELSMSHHTIRNALARRTPSSGALVGKFTTWLEGGAEAAPPLTFRRGGAGRVHPDSRNGTGRQRDQSETGASPAPAE